ncbi:MAG: hypothetical protein SFU86_16420 [Pirellulaceae bacterium]|nr:hypothetical protein [Pirellulaceae bacterium]
MRNATLSGVALLAFCSALLPSLAPAADWPPPLGGANKDGVATLQGNALLQVPINVEEARKKPGAADFVVAKTAPVMDLALHGDLGPEADKRRLWSCWGDICLASDGRVYCGIGDHGDDAGGDARCFIYCWDPKAKTLKQVVDLNSLVPTTKPHSRWSKIHAKIDEGPDGKIYFSGTLNDGNRAGNENYHWSEQCPGGQLYRYDPKTGKSEVFASLPAKRCTATSLVDSKRGLWWCNLEAGRDKDSLFALDLATGKPVYQGTEGMVGFNRAFALAADGSIYFNGREGMARLDPATGKITTGIASFGDSPGIRCATAESKAGEIWGVTYKTTELYRFRPASGELKLLGPCWLAGSYTAVCTLSPDERFMYFLPGAHGKAWLDGTPVIQYDLKTGQRKVLAFLAPTSDEATGFVPGGTYGIKISDDGGTLYVNFNGHPADRLRPEKMKPIGFGVCGFAAIHIPQSER